MDMIDSLLAGDSYTDEDKMRQAANVLRGNLDAADRFSLSTVKPIANLARSQRSDIIDTATRAGRARQIGLEKAANRKMKEQELAREARWREEDYSRGQLESEKDRQNKLKIQQMRDNALLKRALAKAGKGKTGSSSAGGEKTGEGMPGWFAAMPASEKSKYRTADLASDNLTKVYKRVKDASDDAFGAWYSPVSDTGEGLTGMVSGAVGNAFNNWRNERLTPDQRRDRAAVFNEAYQTIKELAGTAMSVAERSRIEQFTPSPGDSREVILDKLAEAVRYAAEKKSGFHKTYGAPDYDPGFVDSVVSDLSSYAGREDRAKANLPGYAAKAERTDGGIEVTKAAPTEEGLVATKKQVEVSPVENKISNLTGMSSMQLEALANNDPETFEQMLDENPELEDLLYEVMQ